MFAPLHHRRTTHTGNAASFAIQRWFNCASSLCIEVTARKAGSN